MPTLLERAGDFSQSRDAFGRLVSLLDPATGRPFPGNVIPQARLSPQATSLLNYYPLPNIVGGGRFNYQTPVLDIKHQDAAQVRYSQGGFGRNQFFGNLALQRTTTDAGNVFGFTDSTLASGVDSTTNWSHRFSQFLSLRVRYQYTRLTNDVTPYFANRTNVSGDAGIAGNNQDPINWGAPRLQFASGIAGLGHAQAADNSNSTHAAGIEILNGRGRHNLTFGGDIRRQRWNILAQQDARGSFGFTGGATGFDLADFLLGLPQLERDRLRQCRQGFRRAGVRRLSHRRLARQPDPDDQRRRAVGIRRPDRRASRHGSSNLAVTPGFTAAVPVGRQRRDPPGLARAAAADRHGAAAGRRLVAGGPRRLRHLPQHRRLSVDRARCSRSSRRCRRRSASRPAPRIR